MTSDSKKNEASLKKQGASSPTSASQLYQDRLNKMRQGNTNTPGKTTVTNVHNRLSKTSPSSTARKAKKGFRPG
ncbi:MAG: hypothetical protein ACI9H6_000425 [Patiriisocius sp.]|jgi:hypothetical protein